MLNTRKTTSNPVICHSLLQPGGSHSLDSSASPSQYRARGSASIRKEEGGGLVQDRVQLITPPVSQFPMQSEEGDQEVQPAGSTSSSTFQSSSGGFPGEVGVNNVAGMVVT